MPLSHYKDLLLIRQDHYVYRDVKENTSHTSLTDSEDADMLHTHTSMTYTNLLNGFTIVRIMPSCEVYCNIKKVLVDVLIQMRLS